MEKRDGTRSPGWRTAVAQVARKCEDEMTGDASRRREGLSGHGEAREEEGGEECTANMRGDDPHAAVTK